MNEGKWFILKTGKGNLFLKDLTFLFWDFIFLKTNRAPFFDLREKMTRLIDWKEYRVLREKMKAGEKNPAEEISLGGAEAMQYNRLVDAFAKCLLHEKYYALLEKFYDPVFNKIGKDVHPPVETITFKTLAGEYLKSAQTFMDALKKYLQDEPEMARVLEEMRDWNL